MSYDENILEIERLEHELREVWIDPIGPDVNLLKATARAVFLERWFEEVAPTVPLPTNMAERTRLRIRAALLESGHGGKGGRSRSRVRPAVLRVAGKLAAAAGFILLMTAPLGRMFVEQEAHHRPTFGAFDALMASFKVAFDDDDRALMDVERDLDALEDRVYTLPARSTEDVILRKVDEDLDELFRDLELDFDT